MARNKALVRTGTLKKHAKAGLIERIEILDEGQGVNVRVHYNERARGEKTRRLTAYHIEGPKRFSSIDSAWKLVKSLDLHEAMIREENADTANT